MKTRSLALALLLAGCGGNAEAGVAQQLAVGNGSNSAPGVATITWVAPVLDTAAGAGQGGSAIADLAGFKPYYSATSGSGPWTLLTTISNPATLTYDATGLPSGTIYLCVAAYDTAGNIGNCSYAGSKVIP